jgi:RNA polymerase sigma-70 factor (ECF subfamily)
MPVRSSESNVTGVADALLLRAQSGDRAAFEGLMVLHERRVYATARHVLGHAEDAEDALQEVFLRLYRSLGRIEAGKSLAAWLYRVTVNVCCSLLRKRRRYRGAASIDELGHLQLTATEAAPEETLAQRQELVIVQRAIAELPRKERIAARTPKGVTDRPSPPRSMPRRSPARTPSSPGTQGSYSQIEKSSMPHSTRSPV